MSKDSRYVFCEFPEDGENFWDKNKELLNLSPYNKLFKSEGKRRSGRIMSAIYLCFDPKSKAVLSGEREEKEIKNDIAVNYLKEKGFEWSKYLNVITAYKLDCRTKIEKELDYWEMELKSRGVYQRSLPWEAERKEKDEMLKNQKSLFEDYLKVKEQLDTERENNRYHSNVQKSFIESYNGT